MPSATAISVDDDLDTLIGPGSALRRYASDWRVMLILTRASLLQAAYPPISAGVVDHGRILQDPIDRVISTGAYATDLLLGPDPVATARAIRERHRNIGGTDANGVRYHAWERTAWTWVHLTVCEAVLRGISMFHRVDAEELEEVYAGLRAVGRLYQVREQDMPATVAELMDWFDNAIAHDIVDSHFLADLREAVRNPSRPPQVPALVWPLLRPVAAPVLSHTIGVVAGMLPAHIRHWYAPGHTRFHQAEYAVAVTALRAMSLLPERFHTLPTSTR